jgi:hypothetical protein
VKDLKELIARLDEIETLPIRERSAAKLVVFRSVESALRQFVTREEMLLVALRKFRPALQELSIRLIAMEKTAPEMPDSEMMSEYISALSRARQVVTVLEAAAQSITVFQELP